MAHAGAEQGQGAEGGSGKASREPTLDVRPSGDQEDSGKVRHGEGTGQVTGAKKPDHTGAAGAR